MANSIQNRILTLTFSINVIFLFGLLSFSWWALEDLEETVLQSDQQTEVRYFRENGDKHKAQKIITSQIISAFIPKGSTSTETLPVVFNNLPIPYQGEVDFLDKEFSVVIEPMAEGVFYFAKSLALFEERETKLTTYVIALCVFIVLFCFLAAKIFSRRISKPILQLAQQIATVKENDPKTRLNQQYADLELNEIASAINQMLDKIQDATQRERQLISMASHELRTPVSVVMGAANVIIKRNQLMADDKHTLNRIINASEEMSENIHALLALSRNKPNDTIEDEISINALIECIKQDYIITNPENEARIVIDNRSSDIIIHTDKALSRILFHNIIGNAINHTLDVITVTIHHDCVSIQDSGIHDKTPVSIPLSAEHSGGLGLYIAGLACERLGWKIDIQKTQMGHYILVQF